MNYVQWVAAFRRNYGGKVTRKQLRDGWRWYLWAIAPQRKG